MTPSLVAYLTLSSSSLPQHVFRSPKLANGQAGCVVCQTVAQATNTHLKSHGKLVLQGATAGFLEPTSKRWELSNWVVPSLPWDSFQSIPVIRLFLFALQRSIIDGLARSSVSAILSWTAPWSSRFKKVRGWWRWWGWWRGPFSFFLLRNSLVAFSSWYQAILQKTWWGDLSVERLIKASDFHRFSHEMHPCSFYLQK